MTKEQLISEKARLYSNHDKYDQNEQHLLNIAFQDGAYFALDIANKWISTEDELPEEKTHILIKTTYGVLLGQKIGDYFIDLNNRTIGKVTHWRHIQID